MSSKIKATSFSSIGSTPCQHSLHWNIPGGNLSLKVSKRRVSESLSRTPRRLRAWRTHWHVGDRLSEQALLRASRLT